MLITQFFFSFQKLFPHGRGIFHRQCDQQLGSQLSSPITFTHYIQISKCSDRQQNLKLYLITTVL